MRRAALIGLAGKLDRPIDARECAEDRFEHALLALAFQAAETIDLAGAHCEADIEEFTGEGQVLDGKKRRNICGHGRTWRREKPVHGLADHQRHDALVVDRACWEGAVMLSRAKNRDRVGKRFDLVETMGNEEDAATFVAQFPDDGEHFLDGGGAECGCRLVEDQQAWFLVERLGDFHPLPIGQRQLFDGRVEGNALGSDQVEGGTGFLIGLGEHEA